MIHQDLINKIIIDNNLVANYEEDDYISGVIRGMQDLSEAIQAEYDKLCPKPSEFKHQNYQYKTIDWNYISIDTEGIMTRFIEKPLLSEFGWANNYGDVFHQSTSNKQIPLGLDWRLCCWSLEDAKRIHGVEE